MLNTIQERAAQGHAGAQRNLAYMYLLGKGGLAKDENEAARLYQLAAAQGDAVAQRNLAYMYLLGKGGLAKDENEAARLYQLAAARGNPTAQYRLGWMYGNGTGGLAQDDEEAVRLYQLGAAQRNTDALWYLGYMYSEGRGGLQKDVLMAIGLLYKAFKEDNCSHPLRNLCDFITFRSAKFETKEPGISEDDALAKFRDNTRVLTRGMHEKSLLHDSDSCITRPSENNFTMNLLYPHYTKIAEAGTELDYFATRILGDHQPGFLITCIRPTKRIRNEYREHSEGEKTGFCTVNVDGEFYHCIDGNNPKLGYDLKSFLKKKKDYLIEIDQLNDKLLASKETWSYVTTLFPSFKPQLEQVEAELALLPKARESIENGFSDLANLIKHNVGYRNRGFRDAVNDEGVFD